MSLIRTGVFLAAVIMLLPTDERKPAEPATMAIRGPVETATFCERNPSTCATGRDTWALFLRKAEYGMELGARLLREQLLGKAPIETSAVRADAPPAPPLQQPIAAPPAHRPAAPTEGNGRRTYSMDHPRWR